MVEHTALFLLAGQAVLAAIALFILVDGLEWVRTHWRAIIFCGVTGLGAVFVANQWAPSYWAYGGLGIIGLLAPASAYAYFGRARNLSAQQQHLQPLLGAWYVHSDQQHLGPFSTAELVERFSKGEIASCDYVWRPGMLEWKSAFALGLERFANAPPVIPLRNARNRPEP